MYIAITNRSGRNTKNWKNTKISWDDLKDRLEETLRTRETVAEYHAMPKKDQAEMKDHGGFVGGYLDNGKRSPSTVRYRTLICLDADFATEGAEGTFALFTDRYPVECLAYSTHSHTPEKARIRIIIPLKEHISADEYKATSRKMAEQVGMDYFDPTTFQPERLMYWPSTPKDGEYFFKVNEGPLLDAATILSEYPDPNDISAWPLHPLENKILSKKAATMGDPREKEGLIGAFCRAYSLLDALEIFLSDKYEPTLSPDRYTYTKGTSAAGAIVYQDTFLFSHHSTDPTMGQLCNAFDLVRIHLYGELDAEHTGTKPNSFPSFKKMMALCRDLPDVAAESVHADFSEYADDPAVDLEWIKQLTLNRFGEVDTTIPNFEIIIDKDPRLTGRFYYDEFEDRTFARLPLPWDPQPEGVVRDLRDVDDSNLESYITKHYRIHNSSNIKKAFDNVCHIYRTHPVREYLDKLKWDGTPRIETLLKDYMGADDSAYTRCVIRKALTACVTRIYHPGTKFDNALILIGPEGIYKSTLIAKLGGKWFSDSFMGVAGLDAMQQLQGTWLMEMPELAGLKKAEVTAIKSFLSKTMDKYRSSYGRRNNIHPRQTVFFGTTNEYTPLKGDTGNRRFWPVTVKGVPREKFDELNVDQVWAEARELYLAGETLYLPDELREEAKEIQKRHTETDSRQGMIANYLDMPLPRDWEEMTRQERVSYINRDKDDLVEHGSILRDKICAAEVWVELFNGHLKDVNTFNTKPINESLAVIPGWEPAQNPLNFSIYGRQRAYIRVGGTVTVKTKKIEQEELY